MAIGYRATRAERGGARPGTRRESGPASDWPAGPNLRRIFGNRDWQQLEVAAPDSPAEREAKRAADAAAPGSAPEPRRDVRPKPPLAPRPGLPGSTGHPLDAAARQLFEPRLGRDLSQVRVHTGPLAAACARQLRATAFTVGTDIAFAAGRYAPGTLAGRRTLGHELAHATQPGLRHTILREDNGNRSSPSRSRAEGQDRATSYRRITMRFDGEDLIVSGDGRELFSYGASSGRPILISAKDAERCGGDPRVDTYMSPRFTGIQNKGPIPEGTYRFSPPSIQEFTTAEQMSLLWAGITGHERIRIRGQSMHTGDWGAGRVPLRPVRIERATCGNPRERHSFYLHGGLLAGSSGCIDIGTKFDELAEFLRGFRGAVMVEVRYKTQTPRVGFLTGLGGALAYQGFRFRHGPGLRLGFETGSAGTSFVPSAEYQVFLGWAGGALSAGVHLDVPLNDREAFVRAGLRGGAEFRIIRALYGQLSAGGFLESPPSGSAAPVAGGWEAGGGIGYDFGRQELGLMYTYLRSTARDERHQLLLRLGFHF